MQTPLGSRDAWAPLSPDYVREVIGFWVQAASLLGFPRSVGETYGALFLAERPLTADDLVLRLGFSRSAAGAGVKTLLEARAIRLVHQPGSRKDHFEIQPDLGVLVNGVLYGRIFPQLEDLERRRKTLHEATRGTGGAHLIHRFEKLQRWQGKARPALKMLKALTA
jgi:HTH-type transcriptional regulator, glycine betaine synthesis regulator